jgi:trigger factor
MRVDVIKGDGCECTLSITIEQDQIEDEFDVIYKELSREVRIPGFRVGRVPRAILESRMGKEVERKAIQRLLSKAYEEAIKRTGVDPLTPPRIEDVDYKRKEVLSFKAHLEVRPEFQLDGYKGLSLRKRIRKVTEEGVDERLKSLQRLHGELVNVDGRGVRKGDIIEIDHEGFVEGEPIPRTKGEGVTIEVGRTKLIGGIEEGIIGMEVGEEKEIVVTLGDDYPLKEFRGQKATFKIRLHSIKETHLPQIDDEFAKDLGKSNLKELRASIEDELKEFYQREAEERAKKDLLNLLVGKFDFPLPKTLLEREIDLMVKGFEENLAPTGLSLDGYLKKNNLSMERLREDFRGEATKRLKGGIILDAIAEREGIEVEGEDLSEEIESMAKAFGTTPNAMRERLEKENGMDDLRQRIRVDKTLSYLLNQCEVEEVIE